MPDAAEPAFVAFSDLVVGLVREIRDAVDRTQLAQNEAECELRAMASFGIELAEERLVTEEAVELLQAQLLTESGADTAWENQAGHFLKLVEARLGLALTGEDYGKGGLTPRGREKFMVATRRKLAADQLDVVRRLVNEGNSRVKVGSGAISIKLEMRAQMDVPPVKDNKLETATPRRPEVSGSLPAAPHNGSGLRVMVRPAQQDEGEKAGAFGELKINFVVV